ncbi:hypothetical protein N0V94_001464 [Neodidymelliopsis sp. IMI 364377]|nr:hypothetical protein N0V94_001464 [Neodidymelliopsis sp. IMI 364377]
MQLDHDDCNRGQGLEYEHVAGSIIPTASLDSKVASPITDQSTDNDEDSRRFSQVDRISATADEFSDGLRSSNTVEIGNSTEDKTTDAGTLGHVLAVSSLGKVTEDFRSRRVDHVENMTEQVPETPFLGADEVIEPHKTGPSNNQVDSSAASAATVMQSKSQSSSSQANEDNSLRPASSLTPQEATLAELKTQKATLLASLVALPAIQILIEEGQSCDVVVSDDDGEPTHADIMAAANTMVKEHIKLLHEYNELKDVGQGLMGLIADQRGVRIVEVQDEFGINAND